MTFRELLEKLSPKLRGIAFKLRGFVSFLSEEDLYQEAVLHLWQDYNRGRIKDNTDSYILQGCYYHLRNYIRVVKDKKTLVSLDAAAREDEGPILQQSLYLTDERSLGYLDNLNDKLLAEAIRNNGLNGREKSIIEYFSQGMTTREVGRRLGVSHVSIVRAMTVIREKCRRHLD